MNLLFALPEDMQTQLRLQALWVGKLSLEAVSTAESWKRGVSDPSSTGILH